MPQGRAVELATPGLPGPAAPGAQRRALGDQGRTPWPRSGRASSSPMTPWCRRSVTCAVPSARRDTVSSRRSHAAAICWWLRPWLPRLQYPAARNRRARSRDVRRWMMAAVAVIVLLLVGLLWQGLARIDARRGYCRGGRPAVDRRAGLQGIQPATPTATCWPATWPRIWYPNWRAVPDLRVVSSQSSFQFAGGQTPLAEIGRRLRSRYIVDGTVRREGEQLRIVVELLDSQSGQVMWSVSQCSSTRPRWVRRSRHSSGRIAGTLQSKVARTEQRRALAQPPKTLDAYVLVAHGRVDASTLQRTGHSRRARLLRAGARHRSGVRPGLGHAGHHQHRRHRPAPDRRVGFHARSAKCWRRSAAPSRSSRTCPSPTWHWRRLRRWPATSMPCWRPRSEAAQLSPNDADCFFILGNAQYRWAMSRTAVRNFEQALDRNPIPPAYLPAFYATALWGSRRLDEAMQHGRRLPRQGAGLLALPPGPDRGAGRTRSRSGGARGRCTAARAGSANHGGPVRPDVRGQRDGSEEATGRCGANSGIRDGIWQAEHRPNHEVGGFVCSATSSLPANSGFRLLLDCDATARRRSPPAIALHSFRVSRACSMKGRFHR